jgi:uncharacterized iron-regulated membrane protein
VGRGLTVRRLWIQVHLWLGLTLGVLGIFIGVSGSVLLYDHQIDRWLNPQRYAVSGPQVALGYADYAARIAQALSGQARVVNLRLPEEDGQPIVAVARGRESSLFYRVYVDPPTGRVLDAAPGGGFIGWLHRFHENLTLREYSGREIVGLVGFAMLISSLTGICLWWPARGRFRESLGARPGLARSRNLHYLLGFYGSLVLAMLSFTGIWLAYVDAGRSVVAAFAPLSPRVIQAPGVDPRTVFRVNLTDGGRPVALIVDSTSGAVLRRVDSTSRTSGDRFLAAQRLLHTGDAFGPFRIVLFIAGFLPGVLAVTGAMMWLRQRRARQPGKLAVEAGRSA